MKEVEYLDEVARYSVFQFHPANKFKEINAIDGKMYKCEGWAKRRAEKMNTDPVVPYGGYFVRRIWVKKSSL